MGTCLPTFITGIRSYIYILYIYICKYGQIRYCKQINYLEYEIEYMDILYASYQFLPSFFVAVFFLFGGS